MSQRGCSKCRRVLPRTIEHFHADKSKSDGLRPDCKECSQRRRGDVYLRRRDCELAKTKEYALRNREKTKADSRQRYERRVSTPEGAQRMRDAARAWRMANSEYARAKDAEWMRQNRGDHAAKCALARARRRRAAPAWLSREQRNEIKHLYRTASVFGMHVDHIFPIAGRMASGLHVPWNLQILSAHTNLKKGNSIVAAR